MAIELSPGIIDLIRIEGKGALVPVPLPQAKPEKPVLAFGAITSSSIELVLSSAVGADTTRVEVSQDGATWSLLVGNITGAYNHTGLGPTTTWYYRAVSVNDVAETVGNEATKTTLAEATTPDTDPTGLPLAPTYTIATSSTSAFGSITDDAGATSFEMRAEPDGGVWGAWVAGLNLAGLAENTAHRFEIRGINASGAGPSGAVITKSTLPLGVLKNGDPLTLTGVGFEAKALPEPVGYDHMDDYAGAAQGVHFPRYNDAGAKWTGNQNVQYQADFVFDTEYALPGRPFCIVANGPKSHIQDLEANPNGPARGINGYFSHWMMVNEDPNSLDTMPDQYVSFKFARYWHGFGEKEQQRWMSALFRNGPPSNGGYISFTTNKGYRTEAWTKLYRWARIEVQIAHTVVNADGSMVGEGSLFIDGKLETSGTVEMPDSLGSDGWRFRLIGCDPNYQDRVSPTFRVRLAEAHMQADLARVELTNESVYDTTRIHRAFYQVCTSRTDTEIQIPSAMLGLLDPALPIYARIFKSDGSVIEYGRVN